MVKKITPLNPVKSCEKAVSNTRTKFTLYNLAGQEKAYYLVEQKKLDISSNLPDKSVAHSIIIIDRSGSMYDDLEPLKETLVKLLTLDEYNNYQLVVTLISYASKGDVVCHFQRVPIQIVMESNSSYIKEIKSIRTAGATCISQAMTLAKSLIQEFTNQGEVGELTAITLHSDGYANDSSSSSEVKALSEVCEQLRTMEVFVNTIAYSDYSDFKLLSKIASMVSGSCIKAVNVKEIYDTLYSTSKLLGTSIAPPIEELLHKDYNYHIFVSKSAKKINGSSESLKIFGVKAEDDSIVYKYQKITKEAYDKLADVLIAQTDDSVLAFAKANLAEGNLNTAKYALVSTFDATLTKKHVKALTNTEIAELSQDIELAIFEPDVLKSHEILNSVKVNDKISLLKLLEILESEQNSIILNIKHLQQNYQRKGLKRINGSRDEFGNLVKPSLKTEYVDGSEYVLMGSFQINRNTATINMLISRQVKLVNVEDETQLSEVAGLLVTNLCNYNNYTIVSNGEINIKSLKVKINTQQAFELLKKNGVLEKDGLPPEEFDFRSEYNIRLDNLPLVPFDASYDNINGVFNELAEIKVLSSILSAHLKEESSVYTPQQLEELKRHYLSKNLYINFPTTTEYSDLTEAIANGTVDSRVSYLVDIGSTEILNLGKFKSANQFLDKLYEAYNKDTGEKLPKPTFDIALDKNIIFGHRDISSRTKITKVDRVMKPIFDNFLGIEDNGTVTAILSKVGADSQLQVLQARWKGEDVSRDDFVTALTTANKKLEQYAEKLYQEKVSPLVFYIGSTGLLPDEIDAKASTSEEISSKYSNLQFSKNEQEGMFFEFGDSIISVYAKNEYYTIQK